MSSSRSERVLAALLASCVLGACSLGGCSLGAVQRTGCEAEDCQAAFGFGSLCGEDGFCQRVEASPRCTRTFPEDLFTRPLEHRDTIVIGSLMDRRLDTQRAREDAAEIAFRSANDTGGLDGRPFGIVFCNIAEDNALDSLTRQEAAVASAIYLAEELRVPAIIGPSSSADVQAVFLAVREHGTLVMSPAATSPALTAIDAQEPTDAAPGLLWRTAPPDTIQARAIVSDMRSRSVASVAVIHATDAYGEGIAQAFLDGFGDGATLLPFDNGSVLAEQVVVAGGLDVDEVLFVSSLTDEASGFINAIAGNAAYDDKGLFLTDSAANPDFVTDTSGSMARWPQIRGTRPSLPSGPVYEIFASRFRTEYMGRDPGPFSFTAHAYDAAWLVLYGIAWAHHQENAINGITIARGLRHVSSGTAHDIQPSTFQPIVSSFANGDGVDVSGASGTLDYDPATEETAGPTEVWTVADLMP